jgi:hypothetical protein
MLGPMLALMALVSGCAAGASKPVCPSLFTYTPEEQARAADELDALPPDSMVATLVEDYGVVRAEIRACRGG